MLFFQIGEKKQPVIDLIVGFLEPHDAVMTKAPDGRTHLIFDLICWNKYSSMENPDEIIRNVLTHEITHFLIGCYYPEADDALESPNYLRSWRLIPSTRTLRV